MRHGSLFSALRGRDGRSLVRAVILLVLVNLFAAGLNSGMAAAATGDVVLCAVDDSDGRQPPKAPDHRSDCCLAGFPSFAMGIAAKPAISHPPLPARHGFQQPEAEGGPPPAWTAGATARGPPLDA